MGESIDGRNGLQATIAGLRQCNAAQCEVIENLEEYERSVLGLGTPGSSEPGGYRGGYIAELGYLHSRRNALDSLISAVERYSILADSLRLEDERTENTRRPELLRSA
jgi:hypothetical protein